MGFWRAVAKATLDQRTFQEADELQASHGQPRGFLAGFLANRRASRYSDEYWRDNQVINDASTPVAHMGLDLGHPRGCDCRWCQP